MVIQKKIIILGTILSILLQEFYGQMLQKMYQKKVIAGHDW